MARAARAFNPLSRREVLKYGAFTTVGGVLNPMTGHPLVQNDGVVGVPV